ILKTAESYLSSGEQAEIEVTVADEFGFAAESFNGTLELLLSENTKNSATLPKTSVDVKKGKGKFILQAGKATADVTIIGKHSELKTGILKVPLLARVNAED